MKSINKLSAVQKAEVKKALASMANGHHRTTAVKLELEAHLYRPRNSGGECGTCNGYGFEMCRSCTEGQIRDRSRQEWVTCYQCEGRFKNVCPACDGSGVCTSRAGQPDWGSSAVCQEFMRTNVPVATRNATVFDRFYVDGSVDSEYTVTVWVKDALKLLDYIDAWNKLARAIGHGMNVKRAGMHISLLNDASGAYDGGEYDDNRLDDEYASNFARSMTPLLPALYFLASPNQQSRELHFRRPRVSPYKSDDYPAICTHNNTSFEYRVFETCYDKPEMFADFLITIAKTLQFYGPDYVDTRMHLGELGIKEGKGLDRLYYTTRHLRALDQGLKYLKPDYKTIAELKAERNFTIDGKSLKEAEHVRNKGWRESFSNVKRQRRNRRLMYYHEGLSRGYRDAAVDPSINPREVAKRYLERKIIEDGDMKGDVRAYVKKMAQEFDIMGAEYRLEV